MSSGPTITIHPVIPDHTVERDKRLRGKLSTFLANYPYQRARQEAMDATFKGEMLRWHTLPVTHYELRGTQARAFSEMFDIGLLDIPKVLASPSLLEDLVRGQGNHALSIEDEVSFCRVILTWRLAEEKP